MANEQLNRQFEFAILQLAAEAFLSRPSDGVLNRPPEEQIEFRLEVGNDHSSKFTSSQAAQFTA